MKSYLLLLEILKYDYVKPFRSCLFYTECKRLDLLHGGIYKVILYPPFGHMTTKIYYL